MATKQDYYCPDSPAHFYINFKLIPCTPHTFSIKQNPKNESDSTVDGRPITRPKLMDAQTFTIEFLLPFYEELNICFTSGFWHERKYFTDYFWELQQKRENVNISVVYPNQTYFNSYAVLESWDYTQSGEKGSDWNFTLTFTEAYPRENIETQYVMQNPYVKVGQRDYRRVS